MGTLVFGVVGKRSRKVAQPLEDICMTFMCLSDVKGLEKGLLKL